MKGLRFTRRKIAIGGAIAVFSAGGVLAYAYFTASGSGTGTGTAGSASNATVIQAAAAPADYSNGSNLLPGTTQTVHLTVKNNSTGSQHINQVTLDSTTPWTSNQAGCDNTSLPGSFTMPAVTVNETLTGGATSLNHDGVVTFVDTGVDQNACQAATITFNYVSN